jgi:hypothetical protein
MFLKHTLFEFTYIRKNDNNKLWGKHKIIRVMIVFVKGDHSYG